MWNQDHLMTGLPIGDWERPTRSHMKSLTINSTQVEGDITLNFGKYKGYKLSKAYQKNPRYFEWLYHNMDENTKVAHYLKPRIEKMRNLKIKKTF